MYQANNTIVNGLYLVPVNGTPTVDWYQLNMAGVNTTDPLTVTVQTTGHSMLVPTLWLYNNASPPAPLGHIAGTTFGDTVSFSTTVASLPVADRGFEQDLLPGSSYLYDPTLAATSWTFANSAGISTNNSAFTGSNPVSPEGTQVAFLQGTGGTISQSVPNWTAGTYTISLNAAQRNYLSSHQDFQILVDSTVVGTFTPTSTSYQVVTTPAFAVTAGSHTVTLKGLDTIGGDNTVFLDTVTVNPVILARVLAGSAYVPNLNLVAVDRGFEQLVVPASPGYIYDPSLADTSWTFAGSAGITLNNSPFTSGNPVAPEGTQVAFLQGAGSTISQSVSIWTNGTYTISLQAAQRANLTSHQDFQVLVDSTVVGTFTPSSTSYQVVTTSSFVVTAGSHTVTFKGLDTVGGDNTVFLDAVTFNQAVAAPAYGAYSLNINTGIVPPSTYQLASGVTHSPFYEAASPATDHGGHDDDDGDVRLITELAATSMAQVHKAHAAARPPLQAVYVDYVLDDVGAPGYVASDVLTDLIA
jgi:hypothetical protein